MYSLFLYFVTLCLPSCHVTPSLRFFPLPLTRFPLYPHRSPPCLSLPYLSALLTSIYLFGLTHNAYFRLSLVYLLPSTLSPLLSPLFIFLGHRPSLCLPVPCHPITRVFPQAPRRPAWCVSRGKEGTRYRPAFAVAYLDLLRRRFGAICDPARQRRSCFKSLPLSIPLNRKRKLERKRDRQTDRCISW